MLVSLVLVPLVLGLIQVGLVLHVRNTLAAAATEGARYGATIDRTPADGAARTRSQIDDAIAARFAEDVSARREVLMMVPVVFFVLPVVVVFAFWPGLVGLRLVVP